MPRVQVLEGIEVVDRAVGFLWDNYVIELDQVAYHPKCRPLPPELGLAPLSRSEQGTAVPRRNVEPRG